MDEFVNSEISDALWNKSLLEIKNEFKNILHYWEQYAVDTAAGGFQGQVKEHNQIVQEAPKGSVLNARILWSFSASYAYTHNPSHLELATRAFEYIKNHFLDPQYGGLYWTVNAQGELLDGHKQIYAQAFGIYGMSEYYRVSQKTSVLSLAINWYRLIEKHSYDPVHGGYTEALSREWTFLKDKRLSKKDKNTDKSMNTHLHIIEAYANLYSVWPDPELKMAIVKLLKIFDEKIIQKSTGHLGLFYSSDWEIQDTLISYGHDIEAGWLLLSCAASVDDKDLISIAKKNAVLITNAAITGFDKDGGLWYEFDYKKHELIAEKHWWPQAEALVGLFNALEITENPMYKNLLLKNWSFIKLNILDTAYGEWHWGIDSYQQLIPNQDKIGLWKCPYHNIRACLEIIKRSEI